MARYVLKILIDLEGRDDIEARQAASHLVQACRSKLPGIRDIVLHSQTDRKSIHMTPDGIYQDQWQKG